MLEVFDESGYYNAKHYCCTFGALEEWHPIIGVTATDTARHSIA
jgi:hypothetical protein